MNVYFYIYDICAAVKGGACMHTASRTENATFIFFAITSAKVEWTDFRNFFTVKFRKDLRRKPKLKLPHPLKSVAALHCEM